MTPKFQVCQWFTLLAAAWALTAAPFAAAAESAQENERKFLAVLQSDAPPAEKAMACKRLLIYGTKESVPALASLLPNPELSSWARIALEAIPDSATDEALRAALGKLDGRLLVGVINSISVRRDQEAVGALTKTLQDADADAASAAAEALGHIGGLQSARALELALNNPHPAVRSAAAYGAVVCAEGLMAGGKSVAAASLCDRVRQASVPKQRVLEATRGAILARNNGGIPLLLEQLRSPDMALFGIGVRTARELPGRQATQALASEMDQASPDRQVPLLLALADRDDAAVLPKLLQVAERGAKPMRLTAVSLLDRFQDLACVPVLLTAAAENDPELARTAKAGLARLGGKEVDADLLARLRLASGKTRQVLIELAGQRRIESAIPIAMRNVENPDAGIRRASLETVGVLGRESEAGGLARLLAAVHDNDQREEIERALLAISRRSGTKALPQVLPLTQATDPMLHQIGLRALSSMGGPESLAAVKQGLNHQDEVIRDEAVNLLATWPNTWPEDEAVAEPLLTLINSAKKPAYRAQALRGYLQYLEETQKLSSEQKIAKLNELLTSAKAADEKRQVVSVVSTIPTRAALELLMNLAQDTAVAEEAYLGAMKIATDRKNKGLPADLRRGTLQTVAEKSTIETTKKKAADELKKIN